MSRRRNPRTGGPSPRSSSRRYGSTAQPDQQRSRTNSAAGPTAQPDQQRSRDQEAVSRFIERFSSVLTDSGTARMPARVFVALLAADSGRQNAAELADTLQV